MTDKHTKKEKLGPVAPRGVDPRSPYFQCMWRWTHPTYFIQALWVRPLFTELGPKNPHFAKKQTNICRLSGDIKMYNQCYQSYRALEMYILGQVNTLNKGFKLSYTSKVFYCSCLTIPNFSDEMNTEIISQSSS